MTRPAPTSTATLPGTATAPSAQAPSAPPGESGPGVRARPALVILALSTAVLAFSLMQTLLVPALPTLGEALGSGPQGTGWILTAFLVAGAVLAPVVGSLGDRYGHRRVLVVTLVVFAAATVAAGLAPNLGVLLAARVVQGVSTATFPLALAISRRSLDGRHLVTALGWLSGMVGVGAGVALVLGGLIVESLSWHWLFWSTAALVLVALAMVLAWVPATPARPAGRAARTDWAGTFLLAGGLAGLLLAVSQGRSWGWTSPLTWGVGLAAVCALAVLVLVELRSAAPLVDVRTFRNRSLVITSVLTLALGFVPYVFYVSLPLILQAQPSAGSGLTVTQTGLVLLPSAVLVFVGGRVAPALSIRFGAKSLAITAVLVMAVAGAGLAVWPGEMWSVLVFFTLLGLGNGIGFAVCAQLVTMLSPADEVAAATGLNAVLRTVGSAVAAPVTTALLAGAVVQGGTVSSTTPFSVAFGLAAVVGLVALVVAGALPSARAGGARA
ncbi:MFS transporter [Oerskovia enterophila]|uniref:Multidrug resistance protein EmrY n=1 Tax=Oerskovia enterophila TaxID=43678 RepID=A0ABX2Y1K4_9CELL|nr:MFS transporter [Oerskovia enterophila]OCI30021.1 putative multidrug resistance protein EmrY [Oerskovia enterophila]